MKEHNLEKKASESGFAFLTTDQSDKGDNKEFLNTGLVKSGLTTNPSDPHTYGNSIINSSILPK